MQASCGAMTNLGWPGDWLTAPSRDSLSRTGLSRKLPALSYISRNTRGYCWYTFAEAIDLAECLVRNPASRILGLQTRSLRCFRCMLET